MSKCVYIILGHSVYMYCILISCVSLNVDTKFRMKVLAVSAENTNHHCKILKLSWNFVTVVRTVIPRGNKRGFFDVSSYLLVQVEESCYSRPRRIHKG